MKVQVSTIKVIGQPNANQFRIKNRKVAKSLKEKKKQQHLIRLIVLCEKDFSLYHLLS